MKKEILKQNTWKLYEIINKHPYSLIRELQSLMKWRRKKVLRHLRKLGKANLIRWRLNKVYPTSVKELINWEEFNK